MPSRQREAEIIAEEAEIAFREQVRKDLKFTKTRGELIWEKINSPIILWLLSSVLISGISFLYTKYDAGQRREAESRIIMRRIDAEIALRLDYLRSKLVSRQSISLSDLHFEIDTAFSGRKGNLYLEYQSIDLLSMLALAMLNVPEKDLDEIGHARDAAGRLTALLDASPGYQPQIELVQKHFHDLYIKRWQLTAVVTKK